MDNATTLPSIIKDLREYGLAQGDQWTIAFPAIAKHMRTLALASVDHSLSENDGYHNTVAYGDIDKLEADFADLDADNSTLLSEKFAAVITTVEAARQEDNKRIEEDDPRELGYLAVSFNDMATEARPTHPGLGFLVKTRTVFEDIVSDVPTLPEVREAMALVARYPNSQVTQTLQSLFLINIAELVSGIDPPREKRDWGSLEFTQNNLLLFLPGMQLSGLCVRLRDALTTAQRVNALAHFDAIVGKAGADRIGRPAFSSTSLQGSPATTELRNVFKPTVRSAEDALALLPEVCGKIMLREDAIWPWMTLVTGPYV